MLLPLIGVVAVLLRSSRAVFADEAYNIDYHHALLGLPQEATTFFHQPNPTSKASLIYTLSEEGVVGAVNPRDGSLVWRQRLSTPHGPTNASFLRAAQEQDTVFSGTGSKVTAWSAADGRLTWDHETLGPLEDLEILGLNDGEGTTGAKDAIVLTSGEQPAVQRLDGATGDLRWTHKIETGDMPYQISASSTHIYAILLHKTLLGYIKIKVVVLDPVTGRKTDEYALSSESELATPDTIIAVGANSASPIIAWTDQAYTVLKVNILGSKSVASFPIVKHDELSVDNIRLHAPYHSTSMPHFLVQYETENSHWAEVYHIDLKKNKIEKAYDLPKATGKGAFSTSTTDANVYFTRITSDEVVTLSSASHGILGKWPVNSFGTAAPNEAEPVHSVSEVSLKGGEVSAVRTAVLLTTGEWVLVRDGSALWQRPEILATTVTAAFSTPVEVESFAQNLEIEAHSNVVAAYVHRVKRHLQDWQRVPEILSGLPQRIQNGLFGTTAESSMVGDVFGFHQIIACATKNGRVIALDAGSPQKILWNKVVAQLQPGQLWKAKFESSSDGVLVLSSSADSSLVRLNATTGNPVAASAAGEPSVPAPNSIAFTLRDGGLHATKPGNGAGHAVWNFFPPKEERIVSITPRPVDDPVASIGKVLGDRRVLYKYLSPNLALLVTANDANHAASFHLLDTITGNALHADVHHNVDLSAPIASILTENWFAYSFTSESGNETPKGHHLVVGEIFESFVPNDRGPLGDNFNSSSLQQPPEPFVMLRSYQVPEVISKLAITRTRQGITSRQLLAVLPDSDSIVGIPYPVLDPRRPVGRDPTKDEQMEGLVRYQPVIEFDPKWILNHKREVLGIQEVVTSPALIESTSLVFAYGLDVFGTRLTPSFSFDILGKDFNKFQMLATVAALAVATFVVAPLVSSARLFTSCYRC
jgi:outer membrane protein assembly factor BamB